jgi:hypothetical protein
VNDQHEVLSGIVAARRGRPTPRFGVLGVRPEGIAKLIQIPDGAKTGNAPPVLLPGQAVKIDFAATTQTKPLTHRHNGYHGKAAMLSPPIPKSPSMAAMPRSVERLGASTPWRDMTSSARVTSRPIVRW